jgi:hypothetical protein
LHLQQSSTLSKERNMTTRYIIAAALMASACAAHADVLPGANPAAATVTTGSNVAGVLGDASMIAGVSRGAGSDALVQALYDKVSAAVGNDMKVSLKQGIDGVYVQGLSTAKAAALAGDGMSVINTSNGFKVVPAGNSGPGNSTSGGGQAVGAPSAPGMPAIPGSNGSNGGNNGNNDGSNNSANGGSNPGLGLDLNAGLGNGNGKGNQAADANAVPEPSTVFLMLAGMLGVVGLRRRAR